MRIGHWLQSLLSVANYKPVQRRSRLTRQGDQATPFAAQVLELEARVLPATIVVTTTADIINAGDGVISLREAIIQANTNAGHDIIQLSAGTYTLTLTGAGDDAAATGDLDILNNGNVTIIGAGANQTTISASGLNDRVLQVLSGATLALEGVTITGGSGASHGGGILSQGTTTISNSTVTGNSATSDGGGVASLGGILTVTSSTISGNTGAWGGGIEQRSGTLTIADSTISGNISTISGGGMDLYQSTATITNTTISGNSAANSGGGFFIEVSTATISNSTFTNNRANAQGGSSRDGGAISVSMATLTLRNSIVVGNLVGTASDSSDVAGTLAWASAFNLIGDSDTDGGLTHGLNGNIIGVVPGIVLNPMLADNGGPTLTHALIIGSPAINAGDPAFDSEAVPCDQRGTGFDRVLLGRIDMGAVETPNTVPTLASNPSATTFSKKAAKKNGAPKIVPNISVTDPDNLPVAKLGGGTLTFSLDLQGKQHKKKGFLPFDTIGGLAGASAIGTLTGPTQDGNRMQYQITLHAETTAEQVQDFLRGLTFSTKGKGAKVAARLFRVQVADVAGAASEIIEQTINVGK